MNKLKNTALATSMALALSGTAYADLNTGLILYMPFDGNALDNSGHERHGTEYGEPEYVPSEFGQALHLNGNLEQYITVPHDETLNFKDSFTISLWIYRLDDFEYGLHVDSIVVGKGRDCFNSYLISRNGTQFKVKKDGDCSDWSSVRHTHVDVPQKAWHLVTTVFDKQAEKIKFYLDGELADQRTVIGYQSNNDFPLVIGKLIGKADASTEAYPTMSNLDELRLYNRALSECEIKSLYTGKEMCPPSETCQLYGVQDNGLNNSQLFAIELTSGQIKPIGSECLECDIEALDIPHDMNVLYAASGDDSVKAGFFYKVNTQTGGLTEIGPTGFNEIEGLSFDKEKTLWAWAKGDGLIQIDLQTGVGTLIIPSSLMIEDITWNNDDSLLYGAEGRQLWVYDGEKLKKACDLPGQTEALEMLPDNRLLIGVHGQTHLLDFKIIDLASCEIVAGVDIPTEQYDDVEGIAYPEKACATH
jgi:hypothetical protein